MDIDIAGQCPEGLTEDQFQRIREIALPAVRDLTPDQIARRTRDNLDFVDDVQAWLIDQGHEIAADGWAGDQTRAAWVLQAESAACVPNQWPAGDQRSLRRHYGEPGDESNLAYIEPAYPLRLSWQEDKTIHRFRCHWMVKDSLTSIFDSILAHYGDVEAVRRNRMDLFGGCFVDRAIKGGTEPSTHSWGIAIDLDTVQNPFDSRWPGEATMPAAVIEIFQAEGWLSAATAWGYDAMHFQATRG